MEKRLRYYTYVYTNEITKTKKGNHQRKVVINPNRILELNKNTGSEWT